MKNILFSILLCTINICYSQTLISKGKPVKASLTHSSSSISFINDGDNSTVWNAGSYAPQFVEIDLQENYDIKTIKLIPELSPSGTTSHKVFTSNDFSSWKEIDNFSEATVSGKSIERTYNLSNVRGIRIQTLSSPSWIAWREIEVYGLNGKLFDGMGNKKNYLDTNNNEEKESVLQNHTKKLFKSDGTYRTDGVYIFSVLGKNGIYEGLSNDNNRNDEQNLFGLIFKENGDAFIFYNLENHSNSIKGFSFYTSLNEFNNPTYFGKYTGISYSDYIKKEKNEIIAYILINEFKYKPEDISEYGKGDYFGRKKNKIQENIPLMLTGKIKHSFTLNNHKINHVATSKLTSINETLYLDFIEVPELSKESLALLAKKAEQEKITAANNAKKQAENERLAKIKYNQERIKNLKLAQVGDRICFSQGWVHHKEYRVFLGVGNVETQNYTMRVISYVERREGDRYQIRVANIESSNNNNWSYPKLNGVELKEQSLHWIKPNDYINSMEWNICE